MNPNTAQPHQPVSSEQLKILDLPSGSRMWDQLHESIQSKLANLDEKVSKQIVNVQIDCGRTIGRQFFVFTYRTYSIPNSLIDPVVVGMTFTPANGNVKIEADISGEQNRDLIVGLPQKTVPITNHDPTKVAMEFADSLCQSADKIVQALLDVSRVAD